MMKKVVKWKFAKSLFIGTFGLALLTILFGSNTFAFNQSPQIPLFKTALRGVGPGQIPVAAADPTPAPVTGVMHYQINISQYQDQILPPGFGKTTLWGYNPLRPLGGGFQPQKHLGGIIVAKGRNPNDPTDKNIPIQITFRNSLFVNQHILPVDRTVMMSIGKINAAAVHLHGGLVPWISDGGPFDWVDPYGTHGPSFLNNQVLNPTAVRGASEYYYPINQSARFMWYHDHAHGITRLNAYAGLASAMLVRDKFEAGLIAKGLPPYIESSVLGGKPVQELPLVFQDKIFVGGNIQNADPGWSSMVQTAATKPGSLWYAHTYEANNAITGTGRWDLETGGSPLPDPSVIPEFFGDTMLVNGTAFPEAPVEARRYRLRMLNACNARFLNLQLYIADNSLDGITLDANGVPTNPPFVNAATGDSSWLQIGTEGGFLSKPAKIASNQPFGYVAPYLPDPVTGQTDPSKILSSLLVAPAERPDLIVDFRSLAPGTKVVLYNDAPAPFPSGDDRYDFFPGWNVGTGLFGVGNPVNGTTKHGFGPNTRVLMRFKVVARTSNDNALAINTSTDLTGGIDPALLLASSKPSWNVTAVPSGVPIRKLTLNEYFDEYGRLIQIIGNEATGVSSLSGTPYEATATYLNYAPSGTPATVGATEEHVTAGQTEVWEVYNATGDVHPMHIHLVNVQLINRELFFGDPSAPGLSGIVIPPAGNELGWKETIAMYPGTVSRFIAKFDVTAANIVNTNLQPITTQAKPGQLAIVGGQPPVSPRTGGFEYVWHCHILEHEEHDMMHALVVTPSLER